MAMAAAANQPESDHPLTRYYFKAQLSRLNYVPNAIDYNPIKMPLSMPPTELKAHYQRRDNNYSVNNLNSNYWISKQNYSPLDSAVALYEQNKSKMHH